MSLLKKLLHKNWFIYLLLSALCIFAYANTLRNEFTVVDDIPTFVNNESVHSFTAALRSYNIQIVLYAIFYKFFGVNPIPLHVMSISLHILNAILLFTIIKYLWNRKVALIAAVLFTIHPVNTEAVTWISGNPYLMVTLCSNLTLLMYILYKKYQNKNYLITSIGILFAGILFIQSIWLVTIPIIIFIVEQCILEKKIKLSVSKPLVLYVIPMIIFGVIFVAIKGPSRLSTRTQEKPLNQQALTPVIEGGPYTVFTMANLYIFPKDLMIYYDGNPIRKMYYVAMFIFTLLYGLLILYLWNKNRALAGILMILVVSLAPTFSPLKVAWFLSERYLYYGTGFFCTILALLIMYTERKVKTPILTPILVILLIFVYGIRTTSRNAEFKNSKSLALATIRTSPMSIRGYDDLAGDYLTKGDYKTALPLYRKTLTLLPDSNTAISNLGYIYTLYGFPQTANDLTEKKSPEELYRLGSEYYKREQYTNAFYYLYQSILLKPNMFQSKALMADIYIKTEQLQKADEMYKSILAEDPKQYAVYNKLAYIAFQKGDYDLAEKYLREVLKKQPNNKNLLDNLQLLEQTKLQKKIH